MKLRSIPLVLVLCVHIFLGLAAINCFSPTFDEPPHLASGYIYWKTGDYRINAHYNPAFAEMWAALPLLILNPYIPVGHTAWLEQKWSPSDQYNFADKFLYSNRIGHEKMIFWGRCSQLALSAFFCFLLFFIVLKYSDYWSALLIAGIWAVSPFSLAHGTLISTDMAFTIFFFLFFAALNYLPSWRGIIGGGISLGLCFGSKYLAVSIGPIVFILLLWGIFFQKKKYFNQENLLAAGALVVTALLVLLAIYRFQSLDLFIEGLSNIARRSQSGRATFLFGLHSTKGWPYYFPAVFFIKSPLPILLAFGLSLYQILRKKIAVPTLFWIPPLLFLLLACSSKVQIGHRHILAVYPFVLIIIAIAFSSGKWARILLSAVLLWTGINSLWVKPNYLAFFNELIGGSGNGYKYLTDSNLDWGQGLKMLRAELSDDDLRNGIYLNYFGVADPKQYGIKYLAVGRDQFVPHQDNFDEIKKSPKKFAISLTNLQGTYYADPEFFSWLKAYVPWKKIGYCMFVYDFSNNPEAISRLASVHQTLKK